MAKLDLSRLTDKLDSFETVSNEDKSFLKNTIIQAHTSMTNEFTSEAAGEGQFILPRLKDAL